jgi:hypothetical protein
MLRSYFTDHPASVDESYGEHMAVAAWFGARMLLGAVVCFIHALLPFLFVKTGSAIITELHERMVTNRRARTVTRPGPVLRSGASR